MQIHAESKDSRSGPTIPDAPLRIDPKIKQKLLQKVKENESLLNSAKGSSKDSAENSPLPPHWAPKMRPILKMPTEQVQQMWLNNSSLLSANALGKFKLDLEKPWSQCSPKI